MIDFKEDLKRQMLHFISGRSTNFDELNSKTLDWLESDICFRIERHPLGFFKTNVSSDIDGDLRLHFWPSGESTRTEIHSHTWNLRSVVLFGKLANRVYSVTEKLEGQSDLYRVAYFEDGSVREKLVARYDVAEKVSAEYATGDLYELAHSEFHCTETFGGDLVTLVYARRVPGSSAYVVSKQAIPLDFEREILPQEEAFEVRNRIITLLKRK